VAWAAILFGVARAGIGFFVGSLDLEAERAAAASRYLGSVAPGEAIEQGLFVFVFGVVFGVFVSIARSLSERNMVDEE